MRCQCSLVVGCLFVQISMFEVLQLRHVSELLFLRSDVKESQTDSSDAGILQHGKLRTEPILLLFTVAFDLQYSRS